MERILIVGLPRSGTTWLSRALTSADGISLIHEPDNHWEVPLAFRAKRELVGRFYPILDEDEEAPRFERLWKAAFGVRSGALRAEGVRNRIATRLLHVSSEADQRYALVSGNRPLNIRLAEKLAAPGTTPDQRYRVVKSVYAVLAIEWIAARIRLTPVVVVRNPLNVISSWVHMGWLSRDPRIDLLNELGPVGLWRLARSAGVPIPPTTASSLTRATYLFGLLTGRLLETLGRHPEWRTVSHEALSERPHERIRELALDIGLPWSGASDRAIDRMNRPGNGYDTFRITSDEDAVWRRRLTRDQECEIRTVLDGMGLGHLMSEEGPSATL